MPETVSYLKEHDVIRVDSFGETSIEDWESSMDQGKKINQETGTFLVLVDARQQQITPGTMELFNFGANLPAGYIFVVVISDTTLDDHSFLETVGKNRVKAIQIFRDFDEALLWLDKNT